MPRYTTNPDNTTVTFYEEDGAPRVNIKHADVLFGKFRNFGGNATRFKRAGEERFFNVAVPFDKIQQFADHGINVNFWRAANEDDEDSGAEFPGFVKVKINYNYYKKPVVVVKEGRDGEPVEFSEDMIHMLDKAVFDDVGLILNIVRGVNAAGQPYTSLYLRNGFFVKHVNEPNAYEADMFDEYGYRPNQSMPMSDEPIPF